MRSAILVRRKLLNRPVSTATVALQTGFRAVLASDCHLSRTPLAKVSLLSVDQGSVDDRHGIACETLLTRDGRAENIHGAFELAHLNQAAASSVLATGTAASEGTRVFGQAGAKPVWVRTVEGKLQNPAVDFEAEPEEEFLVQAQ
jgi:hypothetical protein